MIQIRRNVFETNSSSTHSLTMCMKEEYDSWECGEVLLNENYTASSKKEGKFIDKETAVKILLDEGYYDEECIKSLDEDEFYEALKDVGIYRYDDYPLDYLEWFECEYTTPGGETVVAFGQYGYD